MFILQLLAALFSKSNVPHHYATQLAWQEILVRLLIIRPKYTPAVLRGNSISVQGGTGVAEIVTQPPEIVTEPSSPNRQDTIEENYTDNAVDSLKHSLHLDLSEVNDANRDTVSERTVDTACSLTPSSLTPQFNKYFNDSDSLDMDMDRDEGAECNGDIAKQPSSATLNSNSSTNSLDNSQTLNITGRLTVESPENTVTQSGGVDLQNNDLEKDREENGDDQLQEAYRRHGLQRDDQMDKTEELCQNVLIILFTILWKGVEGWDDNSWKLRGQVFAAISYNGKTYELLKQPVELNRRLLELMLHGAITDLKETGVYEQQQESDV